MTEEEWLACTEPQKKLVHLGDRASERKLWLFAGAICRRLPGYLESEPDRSGLSSFTADLLPAAPEAPRCPSQARSLGNGGFLQGLDRRSVDGA